MQLTTLVKKSYKGFTLIELLVVIAIIGLLSTIVAAPVQSARKKAKDTKKIAEIKQMETALANYANDNGQFPGAVTAPVLTALNPSYMPALPSSLTATNARDKMYYSSYRTYPVGSNQYKVFGYHVGATLEVYNTVLADDADCWGVAATSSSGVAGLKLGGPCLIFSPATLGATNTPLVLGGTSTPLVGTVSTALANIPTIIPTADASNTIIFESYAWQAHPLAPAVSDDFEGMGVNESASSTCSTIDLCIFDLTESY